MRFNYEHNGLLFNTVFNNILFKNCSLGIKQQLLAHYSQLKKGEISSDCLLSHQVKHNLLLADAKP
jgi:hypothetical protein